MRKYRKKPVIVEAIQLKEDNIFEVYSEVYNKPELSHKIASDKWGEYENIVIKEGMRLKTLESGEWVQIVSIGDYIVFEYTENLGRHYWPVKPDYFEQSYEEID